MERDWSKTIARLRAHAAGAGPEADTARALLAELEQRHPEAAAAAEQEQEIATREIKVATSWERDLAGAAADYLGCEAYTYKDQRRRGHMLVRGPRAAVELVPGLVERLRPPLGCWSKWTTHAGKTDHSAGNVSCIMSPDGTEGHSARAGRGANRSSCGPSDSGSAAGGTGAMRRGASSGAMDNAASSNSAMDQT